MDSPGITSTAAVVGRATQATGTTQAASSAKATDAKPVEQKKVEAPPQEALKPLRDPRSLQFQVEGQRIVTTIVDDKNNTVVAQIPDAEVLRIAAAIDRLKGFFLQEKA
jgi:uncharacterized FlaG/YvyC family protein